VLQAFVHTVRILLSVHQDLDGTGHAVEQRTTPDLSLRCDEQKTACHRHGVSQAAHDEDLDRRVAAAAPQGERGVPGDVAGGVDAPVPHEIEDFLCVTVVLERRARLEGLSH